MASWPLGPSAQGSQAARSPSDAPAWGGRSVTVMSRLSGCEGLQRVAGTRMPPAPRRACFSRVPLSLLPRRVHFHSPVVPLKLSHPVSHSFWIFQNWEERFAFLSFRFSAETCGSRDSSFSAGSPLSTQPPLSPGLCRLGVACPRPRSHAVSPPCPQLGAEVPDTAFSPFSQRARSDLAGPASVRVRFCALPGRL